MTKNKVLVIQPHQEFAKSHFSFTINLAYVLDEAGHEVHLLIPLLNEAEKLADSQMETRFRVTYFLASEELRKAEQKHRAFGPPIPPPAAKHKPPNGSGAPPGHPGRRPTGVFAKLYLEMAADQQLMARLRAQHFDVGIAEAFMTNEWALALFRLLELPRTVVTSAMAAVPEIYYYLGMLGRIRQANVPALRGTRIGDHREDQRRQRADQMWQAHMEAVSKHVTDCIEIDVAFQQLADRLYSRRPFPSIAQLFRSTDVYLVNSQPELDFAASAEAIRTFANVRFVGGVNAARARQREQEGRHQNSSLLAPDISERMAGKRGLVLFSLGTVMDTSKRLAEAQFEAVSEAMRRFSDFLFIFRLSEGDPRIGRLNAADNERKLANVWATDWVDQPAILAHPSTVAFVSHAGMNSVLEAAWNGVPLLCLPCMGDQFYNSEALASKRAALVLDFFGPDFSADVLSSAIGQILEGPAPPGMEASFCRKEVTKLAEKLWAKELSADILDAIIGPQHDRQDGHI